MTIRVTLRAKTRRKLTSLLWKVVLVNLALLGLAVHRGDILAAFALCLSVASMTLFLVRVASQRTIVRVAGPAKTRRPQRKAL